MDNDNYNKVRELELNFLWAFYNLKTACNNVQAGISYIYMFIWKTVLHCIRGIGLLQFISLFYKKNSFTHQTSCYFQKEVDVVLNRSLSSLLYAQVLSNVMTWRKI